MKSLETWVELLRQHGLKITPQRRAILQLLIDDASHPTAEEVYRRVQLTMPDVSRTTVYNTFRELSELGMLAPVHDWNEEGQRYDTNTHAHHHLYCIRCRKLLDVGRDFEDLELDAAEAFGYQILSRQVTFYGICPDCQAAAAQQVSGQTAGGKSGSGGGVSAAR